MIEEKPRLPPNYIIAEAIRESIKVILQLIPEDEYFAENSYDEESEEEFLRTARNTRLLLENLTGFNLSTIDVSTLEGMRNRINEIESRLPELIQNNNAPGKFAEVMALIQSSLNPLQSTVADRFPLLLLDAFSIGKLEQIQEVLGEATTRVNNLESEITARIDTSLKASNSSLEAMKAMKEAAQTELEEFTSSRQTFLFAKDQDHHRTKAVWWLVGAILGMALTVGLAFLLRVDYGPADAGEVTRWVLTPALLQNLALKLLGVSLALYFVSLCVKNYRAHRHLEVANRHRATAFATFKTFMESGETPEVKSAILLEAARTAFTPVPTGYVAQEEDGPDSRLYELIKIIRGSSK